MPEKTSPYLLSDFSSLRRIKLSQLRSQIPALILLVFALALNYIFPSANLYTPALFLALLAIAWFIFIGLCHRYKQRIPQPPLNALISPVQGKIHSIQNNTDSIQVKIRKIILDSVEIRSPHRDCKLEDGALHLATPQGNISFRFAFSKMEWFEAADFSTGNVVGMAKGAGTCTINLPQVLELKLLQGSTLDAGDVLIEDLTLAGRNPAPRKQVIVESFADIDTDNPDL